jgi:hypothetical protein
MLDRNTVTLALLIAIIGVPISYLAMRIESKEINLSVVSWIRIFITFVVAGIVASIINKKLITK